MRILILNWYDQKNPAGGGAERYIHEIFSRLVTRGAQVSLFCRRYAGAPPMEEVDGIRIVRVPAPLRSLTVGALTMMARAWHYYRAHRADYDVVIDCVNKVPFFTPLYVDKPRFALQFHFNDTTFFYELPPGLAHLGALVERAYFRLFYAKEPFVVISQSTLQDLAKFGVNPRRAKVVHPAAPAPSINGLLKSPLPTVVYLGRLKRYKGIDLLLQAMALVIETHPQAQLIIVGDGPERRPLERMAAARGMASNVTFEGRISEGRREEVVGSAWVNVVPSRKEGWGLSVVEAGMLGIPTVATRVPGLWESVVHEKTGYLAEYGDIEAMAQGIVKLIDDADLRYQMGEQARFFAQGFTWEHSAAQMEDFIRELVAGGSAQRSLVHRA